MAEYIEKTNFDAIVIGGGPVGLHTANALYDAMGKSCRILTVTQDSEWGGLAGRSLEQFRLFNDSYAMAEIVDKGVKSYRDLDEELQERGSTERALEQFPYIFTVGSSERPEHIAELLPADTPERPDMASYLRLLDDTISWGFDPMAKVVGAEYLKREYPFLDGDDIRGAMIINNAGRLHFDVMRNYLMERSRADSDGRGVTYRAKTRADRILRDNHSQATGVELVYDNKETYKAHSENIIIASGAHAVNLAQLLPGDESERIARNFTVTQRELFFSNTPGVQEDTNFFLISPDMAIARVSTREGHASYGYAAMDDPVIKNPVKDPRPNEMEVDDLQMSRKELFVGRVYTMLGACSLRWNSDYSNRNKPSLAVKPFGYSAGYYAAYRDDLPVVGEIGETGVILAAGSHHSGVMGGQGIADLVIDHANGTKNLSQRTHEETDIRRDPQKHTGLVL